MRILIIKPSSLGDIIYSLPVAQSIREQIPDARISWVVKKRFEDIVRRCPTVNGDVIVFDHAPGVRGAAGMLRTVRELHRHSYDAVLDFQGLLRSGLMTLAARAPLKVGHEFGREGSRWFCDRVVPYPPRGVNSHVVEKLLQFLPAIGLAPELRSPIRIEGDSPDTVDSRLRNAAPVVLFPNSRCRDREWQGFDELTKQLIAADSSLLVAWDSHIRREETAVRDPGRLVNLTSRTSLMQLVELIRRARLVIANDSGPLHMAAAFGVPTLGLYGPTSPEHTGPYPLTARRTMSCEPPKETCRCCHRQSLRNARWRS
ncbi:MAG: glycosyltransferase family 9 protein [Planctomycetaceae bacterium]